MNKLSIAASLILMGQLSFSGQASAACNGQLQNATVLSNRTLCVQKGSDRFQEYHRPDGALIDWKLGENHAVDPTKQVGNWSASGNNVIYQYGSLQYTYAVYRAGNSPNWCLSGNGEEIRPTRVFVGQGPC